MTGQVGQSHTVFSPPASEPATDPEPIPNVFDALRDALADTELVRNKLRALILSESRHGDLQVTLSAARRIERAVQVLIEAEEQA